MVDEMVGYLAAGKVGHWDAQWVAAMVGKWVLYSACAVVGSKES